MTRFSYTARGPADLLAIIPDVLGFHPEDSVVLMTFGQPNPFHARVDLPIGPEEQEIVVETLLNAVIANAARKVAVVVYSEDAAASDAQCRLLLRRLLDVGVEVVDVVRADGELFYAFEDDGPGTPYDVASHAFTAERVLQGRVVLRNRDELVDSLIGVDEEDALAVSLAAERFADALRGPGPGRSADDLLVELSGHARWLQARIRDQVGTGEPLGPAEAARILVLVSFVPARDVAWGELSRDNAARQLDLWRDLVRRAPRDLLPPAASLLAFAAWLAGDGALAWCALDRALEVDPDYSMAHLVATALGGALHPSTWSPVAGTDLPILDPRRPRLVG